MITLPLSEAKREYSSLLRTVSDDEGEFIYIPPKMECEDVHFSGEVIYLFVGRGAKISFTATTKRIVVSLEEGAHAFFSSKESIELTVSLKKNANFEMVSVTTSTKQKLCAHLLGEEASASFKGLCLQEGIVDVLVRHVAPNCHSHQHFKGVVKDRGRFSFSGKIYVEKEAQKTDAYQLCNALLLGEHALACAEPNLEIFADDVKASHGATVGQLEEEEVFYLQSRGLSKEKATQFLIDGFCNDILRLCSDNA